MPVIEYDIDINKFTLRGAASPPVACIARSFRKAQGFLMDMDINIGLFDIIGVMGTIDIKTDKSSALMHQVFPTREIHDR